MRWADARLNRALYDGAHSGRGGTATQEGAERIIRGQLPSWEVLVKGVPKDIAIDAVVVVKQTIPHSDHLGAR
jgi:hypothetical protein